MASRRGTGVRVLREFLEDRQPEPGCLAGAGLGAAHDVVAGEDFGNRLCLNGRGNGVTGLGHGPQDFGPQAELVKALGVH